MLHYLVSRLQLFPGLHVFTYLYRWQPLVLRVDMYYLTCGSEWHCSFECVLLLLCSVQTVFVAATKVDLPGRKVTESEGQTWAAEHSFPYFEVSGQ